MAAQRQVETMGSPMGEPMAIDPNIVFNIGTDSEMGGSSNPTPARRRVRAKISQPETAPMQVNTPETSPMHVNTPETAPMQVDKTAIKRAIYASRYETRKSNIQKAVGEIFNELPPTCSTN